MTATMTPLSQKLISRIRAYGPMTIAEYMEACLSDPFYGYYQRREPFGRYGDFVTAPEVTQMFGELIGIWSIVTWEAMGSPREFVLAELGPGRGTLMADLVRTFKVVPEFAEAARIHLVETSPRLRDIQATTLSSAGVPITWHGSIDDLPAGRLIVIANEFFDAMPVRQFRWGREGWSERVVAIDPEGKLAFSYRPVEQRPPTAPLPEGAIIETSPVAMVTMKALAARIAAEGGAALVIDYGSNRPGHGDTFQAVRAHEYSDPLIAPGETDLTAHVDFPGLSRAAADAGAKPRPLLTQGDFLGRLGLTTRVEVLSSGKDEATREAIRIAAERLVGEKTMGELFKVLAVGAPGLTLPAFDRRV
jgi:NADH dehydrogenase [ubiquinone] 1 alpha subcomplex assembly factor 7